jgi:hypothetical protein
MFLKNLRVRPTTSSIELGDTGAPAGETNLVDTVFVGIELKESAVRLNTDRLDDLQ